MSGHRHPGRVARDLDAVVALPENTLVRTRLSPPVEVIRRPSLRLGAAPLKASRPPNVLNVMNP